MYSLQVILPLALALLAAHSERIDDFTVVLIPDTQYYSLGDPATYELQAQWIVDEREARNILFAIHLGDVTHKNRLSEWVAASVAHTVLDEAGFPYSITTGNHDLNQVGSGGNRRRTRNARWFNRFFGPQRFETEPWHVAHFGSGNETNITTFEHEGLEFMVVSLEYAPPKDAMCWAEEAIDQHRQHRVIIATHCYQGHDGGRQNDCGIRDHLTGATGQMLWDELVSRYPNIFMMLSGHVGDSEHEVQPRNGGAWHPVHEILTDYQFEQRNGDNHGNGWLRTLRFRPGSDQIEVDVHSVLGVTSFNRRHYNSMPSHTDHKFTLNYTMTSPQLGIGDPIPPLTRFGDRRVNVDSRRHQRRPRIATNAAGDWVVVWEDDSRGAADIYQIYARGFDRNGCGRFGPITVNSVADGQQLKPDVAMDDQGNFVVVWQDDADGNGFYQIKARGFDALGNERFSQRTVNTVADGQQLRPRVAMDADGDFVVVWEDDSNENRIYQIKARGFSASGAERFSQRTVNTDPDGQQLKPAVAMDRNGRFVVVWEDDSNENRIYQIKARGFHASGSERFAQRTVNSVSDGQQLKPAIAMDTTGGFVVVWEDDADGNDFYQIKARGFSASGAERFSQRTVNTEADGQQLRPAVAVDPVDGSFLVAWEDDSNENGVYEIKARGFAASGAQRLSQLTINHDSNGDQRLPAVALYADGAFFVTWQDDLENNRWWEILARGCNLSEGC